MTKDTKSRLSKIACVIAILALIALIAAYIGQWILVHISYPGEFPNDPGSDHGFRLMKIYWLTTGGWLAILNVGLWVISACFAFVAVLRRFEEIHSKTWQIAAITDISIAVFWAFRILAK